MSSVNDVVVVAVDNEKTIQLIQNLAKIAQDLQSYLCSAGQTAVNKHCVTNLFSFYYIYLIQTQSRFMLQNKYRLASVDHDVNIGVVLIARGCKETTPMTTVACRCNVAHSYHSHHLV